MMRKFAVAVAFAGALGSHFANAVGLGELKLNSALNQKLDAEIKLVNIGDLSKNQILPNLASHEDFARAGVERVFFLTGIDFEVRFTDEGNAYIKLTSNKIVREPFLNFLVELHWPSGRILREYTVLLDPPAFSEEPAAKVTEAASSTTKRYKKKVSSSPTGEMRSRPSRRSSTAGSGVRVKKNDTLWGIAKQNRPGSEVTIRQTMLAIQQHNPQAFINNNINLLKAGQVLRIPDIDQIRALSTAQVNQEIARQNQAWEENRIIDASQQDEESVAPTDQTEQAEVPGQLQLLSDEADGATEGFAAGAAAASDDQNEAAAGMGMPDQPTRENGSGGNAGLTTQEAEKLKEQVDSLQRLLALKDQQLAMLQASQSNDATTAEAALPAPDGKISEQSTQLAAATGNNSEASADSADKQQDTSVVPQEQGVLDRLKSNPVYIGLMILGALIVLLVMGAVVRRRNAEREYPEDLRTAIDTAQTSVELPTDIQQPENQEVPAEQGQPEDVEMDQETQRRQAAIRKLVEEADIYIAYGRYERALEMLQPAVNENPEAIPLRLKLAEVFLATGNEAGLSQQESDLQAIGDQQALQKLETLKALSQQEQAQPEEPARPTAVAADVEKAREQEPLEEADDMPFAELGAESEHDADLDQGVEFTLGDVEEPDQSAEAEPTESQADDLEIEKAADDIDFLSDTDEVATKLELGRAYIDMADKEAAIDILNEVVEDGSDEQKEEARRLLQSIA